MGEYLWKDTNLALIGSDEDKKFRKHIAEYEPAWKNVESINCPTLIVWRVKNFGLELVATKDHGRFYNGDSYIVLKAEKKGNKLVYNIHFWIGRYSTQDEYGTAAYKTVELDALLQNAAIQHREVDGYESKMFSSYFTKIEYLRTRLARIKKGTEDGAKTSSNYTAGSDNSLPPLVSYNPEILRITSCEN